MPLQLETSQFKKVMDFATKHIEISEMQAILPEIKRNYRAYYKREHDQIVAENEVIEKKYTFCKRIEKVREISVLIIILFMLMLSVERYFYVQNPVLLPTFAVESVIFAIFTISVFIGTSIVLYNQNKIRYMFLVLFIPIVEHFIFFWVIMNVYIFFLVLTISITSWIGITMLDFIMYKNYIYYVANTREQCYDNALPYLQENALLYKEMRQIYLNVLESQDEGITLLSEKQEREMRRNKIQKIGAYHIEQLYENNVMVPDWVPYIVHFSGYKSWVTNGMLYSSKEIQGLKSLKRLNQIKSEILSVEI